MNVDVALMLRRCSSMVYRDLECNYKTLLSKCKRPLMYINRLGCIALELFKIYHNISPAYLNNLVLKRNVEFPTHNVKSVTLPMFKTVKYGHNSFRYQGSHLWNSLPPVIMKPESDYNVF